jgi:hypothetical protein
MSADGFIPEDGKNLLPQRRRANRMWNCVATSSRHIRWTLSSRSRHSVIQRHLFSSRSWTHGPLVQMFALFQPEQGSIGYIVALFIARAFNM